MSYSPEQLEKIAEDFDQLAVRSLIVEAKKKEKKKLDPKAKVRNRGTVCVPASSAKDKKDHFPINDEGQARNALARVHQYSSSPPWYNGSLEGLQALVSRKVHAKYPSIGKSEKKKKSSLDQIDGLLSKYAQVQTPAPVNTRALTAKVNQILQPWGYLVNNLQVDAASQTVMLNVKTLPNAKFAELPNQENMITGLLGKVVPPGMKFQVTVELGKFGQVAPNYDAGQPGVQDPTEQTGLDAWKFMQQDNSEPTPPGMKWTVENDERKLIPVAPAASPATRPTSSYSDEVHRAQQKVNSLIMGGHLNYKALDPDGKLGPLTRGALKAYKEQYLKVPHLSDEEALKALNGTTASLEILMKRYG